MLSIGLAVASFVSDMRTELRPCMRHFTHRSPGGPSACVAQRQKAASGICAQLGIEMQAEGTLKPDQSNQSNGMPKNRGDASIV